MRINYNVQAMNANLALNKADSRVSQAIARLSSGLKISAAKDEPSGYAISKRMNLQIEGLSRATQSSNDAINIISIADGALQEVSDMTNRISELAVKAATETMTDEDRKLCQDEIAQLKKEIQRVADTTEFNGQTLLDGSFDLKGYTDNLSIKVATYSDETSVGKYTIPAGLSLAWDGDELDSAATVAANDSFALGSDFPDSAKVSAVDGTLLTITGPDNFSITLDVAGIQGITSMAAVNLDITGLGAMDMQIGANEDQILAIRIPELSLKLMSIDDADASTHEGASKLIEDSKTALTYISDLRSRLGAYQNRLEHTVGSLGVTNEAMTAAYSGLVDADMAEETVEYSTAQIISQASTSVLAQANDRPSAALQLLQ
ncbi:MAG: flagellin [Lachnospiraceae bacterium]|nr:flagellin [Lachnospiraceae bacterium]